MVSTHRHRSLASLFGQRDTRIGELSPRRRSRGRWMLEVLEDRTLLSLFTVNSLGDSGTGSGNSGDLRYVINQVDSTSGDNTINFSVTGTISLSSALPDLSNTTGLTDIEGPGAANLTVAGSFNELRPFRIFTVDPNADANLVGLTITGGLAGSGGGIYNAGTLTVTNSTISGNGTEDSLGYPSAGAGIANVGTLTVANSTIDGNMAADSAGGGIFNDAGGTLTVTNSTIANNIAHPAFGGYAGDAAGILNFGTLNAVNTTIAYNSFSFPGGFPGGTSIAGGLATFGPTTLDNTIVALNTTGVGISARPDDITGSVDTTDSYNNLIGIGGSGGLAPGVNGNQVGVANPRLGTLADNGGPTQAIALLPGSPAIDAGSSSISGVTVPSTDQRGALRGPVGLNAGFTVDIGAYEASSSYLVTSTAGSGDVGTLRAAVGWANVSTNANPAFIANPVPNTVFFDTAGVFATPQTITLSPILGTLELSSTSTAESIDGPGAAVVTVSGNNAVRVFQVDSGVTAALSGLTISGGSTSGDGGGIWNGGTLAITNSTITGNSAADGGGIENTGMMTVANSTIANNSTSGNGGGIDNIGTVTITSSTLAANSAGSGGGVYNSGTLTTVNATIAYNSAASYGDAGGLEVFSGTATLGNTIVALNTDGTGNRAPADDIDGTVSSSSAYNLIGTGGSGGLTNVINPAHNQVGVANPGLGALASNGGPTETIALLPGSPAIGEGSNPIPGLSVPTTDQRGVAHPSHSVDIGAFQDRGFTLTDVTASSPQSTAVNTQFANLVAVIVSSPYGDPVQGGLITFTAPTTGASASLSAVTATIGANGQASVAALANTVTGGFTVQASAAGAASSSIISLTNLPLANVFSVAVGWGSQSAPLVTAADGLRLLPIGRTNDLPWVGIQQLSITFNQAVSLAPANVTVSSAIGASYGPVAISGSGTSYTIKLAQPINKADELTITIASAAITSFTRLLDVLPGDVNDDRVVNTTDGVLILRNTSPPNPYNQFYDLNGDGVVNTLDFSLYRPYIGTSRVTAFPPTVSAVNFTDPALRLAVLNALGFPASHVLTTTDMANLTSLSADSSQINSLVGLATATNLVSLNLVPSDFSKPGSLTSLVPLEGLTHLTTLTLQGCGLTDSMLTGLPSTAFPALQSLDLRYNNLNVLTSSVATLPSLTSLFLYGNPLASSPRTGLANLAGKLVNIDLPPDHPELAQTVSGLAAALYYLPIEIYQYVVNTIAYQPYQGAMKGPLAVLQTGAGNDWDTDSLLAGLLADSGISTTQYVTGQVAENVQTTMNWLGVKTAASAYEVLYFAGLRPTFLDVNFNVITDLTQASSAVYLAFDHVWLQASVTVPDVGTQTVKLDPTWKFDDFQPGLPDLLNTVPFNASGYLSTESSEMAYEYYENQVQTYLAANQPSLTIADVPYVGPIQPQSFTTLPTALPFDGIPTSPSQSSSIPGQYENQVRISVDIPTSTGITVTGSYNASSDATTLTATSGVFTSAMVGEAVMVNLTAGSQAFPITAFNSSNKVVVQGDANTSTAATFGLPGLSMLWNVADISLDRITIASNSAGKVTLYLNGVFSASTTQVSSSSTIYPIIQYIPGAAQGAVNYAYTHVYTRLASQYIAVGLNANQFTEQTLVDARQTVNQANLEMADNSLAPSIYVPPSNDDLIGGLLYLALVDYYQQTDQGKQVVGGLTEAIPIYNQVASGLTTSNSTITQTQNPNVQIRYLPGGLGIDLPDSQWSVVGIDDTSVSLGVGYGPEQPTNIARETLTGYTNSSMEAGVWEELANTPSVSTMKSLQYANQNSIPLATITPYESLTQIMQVLKNITTAQGLYSAVCNSISNFVNQGYQVNVPTTQTPIWGETPSGTPDTNNNGWVGVGYLVQVSAGTDLWFDLGFIIQGYLIVNGVPGPVEAPHDGGAAVTYDPSPVSTPTLTLNQSPGLVADPIDIANGDVVHSETDINIPSLGTPLEFQRNYSSFNTVASGPSWSDRGMGDGWSFTYSDTLTPTPSTDQSDPTGTMVWFTDTGILLKFVPNGDVGYITPQTIFGTLVKTGNGYTWTSKTGEMIDFSASGKLLSESDRYGNGVSIAYDSNGHITTVSDLVTLSRTLTFVYTGNHITSITDFTGRTWTYSYDSNGRLASVTDPSNSNTPKAVTQYVYYTDPTLNGLLKTVTDADGNQTNFDYYVNRRGFQVTNASGATQSVSDNLYRNVTSLTDARGFTSYYTYDSQGNETQEVYPDQTTVSYTWVNGLMTTSTDAYGQSESYVYDANGNVTKETDQLGDVTEYTYTDYSNIATVTRESDGAETVYQYFTDASGKNSSLEDVIDPLGDITSYTYPAVNRGLPASMTTPDGNLTSEPSGYTTTYTYNAAGQMTSSVATVAPGQTITQSFVYDNRGNLISSVDGNGNVTTNTYDLLDRLISKTLPDPDGAGPLPAPNTTFAYDAMGNRISSTVTTDSPQQTTSVSYDPMGRVVKKTLPDGTYTTSSYDASGNMVASTDALGRVTQYVYDDRNRAVQTIRADASVVSTGYDGGGRIVRTTDALGHTTTYQYDKLGREIAVTTPVPDSSGPLTASTTRYGYDAQGNLQYVTDALGAFLGDPNHTTTYQYDKLGRITAMIQAEPDGLGLSTRPTTTYTYDANGNLVSVTDPRGFTTEYAYDEQNRKIEQVQPATDGSGPLTTRYYYDNDGNRRYVVDPLGTDPSQTAYTTEYQYDAINRRTAVIQPDPDGSGPLTRPTAIYAYDQNGNLASVTDPLGNITRYQYNLLNRMVATTDALGVAAGDPSHTTVTQYDAVGNVLFVTDALGRTTISQYDAMNRLIRHTLPKADGTSSPAPTTTYQYDANGNLIVTTDPLGHTTFYQYDALNRLVGVTDAMGAFSGDPWNTVVTAYDQLGRVMSVTDQLGRTTQYVYDNLGRKIKMTQPAPGTGSGSPVTQYAYDADGNLISTTDPLGHTTSYGYDGLNRPTTVTDALNGVTTTTFDALGDVVSVTDQLGRTTNYVYDFLGRKIEMIQPDRGTGSARPVTQYGYDADGNLVTTTDPLGHTTTTVFDALNRVTKTIDAQNGTTTNVYDAVGDLLQVTDPDGNTTIYTYDRLGRVISNTDALNHTETFVYDAAGNLIQQTDRDGQVTQYAYDPMNRQITENWIGTNGGIIHTTRTYYDAAGEVVGVIDPGASYSYSYDRDGRLIQTLMAPGDLAQEPPLLAVTGSLGGSNDQLIDWDRDGVPEHCEGYPVNLMAGTTVLVTLDSTAFSPVIFVQAPGGSLANWMIAENSGASEVTLVFTANQSGTWIIGVTERGAVSGAYSLTATSGQIAFLQGSLSSQVPYEYAQGNVTAGEAVNMTIAVNGFTPVLIAQAPNNVSSDTFILGGSGTVTFTPNVSGQWTFFVTSEPYYFSGQSEAGTFSLYVGTNGGPFVQNALVQSNDTYDAAGNLTQLTDSAYGGGTTTYQYDALNRVTAVIQAVGVVVDARANYTYRADGSIGTLTRYSDDGNTVVATSAYSYDGMGRLIGLIDTNGTGTTLASYSWTFDLASNITSMTSVDGTTNYSLDNTNQLTGAFNSNAALANESYTYDANGNRTENGYTTGPNNELLSDGTYTYAYDNDGNLILRTKISDHSTTTYTYDYRNRLTSVVSKDGSGNVTQTVTYTYDASNQLIRRGLAIGAGTASMSYMYFDYQNGNPYIEISDPSGLASSTTTPALAQRYLYAPAVDQLLAEDDFATGRVLWGLADQEGTIRDVVNSLGQVVDHRTYNSFGQITSETNPAVNFPFAYTGQRLDTATGLTNLSARWYNSSVGRFMNEDPAGFLSGDTNLYRYVGNDPLTRTDPSGLGGVGNSGSYLNTNDNSKLGTSQVSTVNTGQLSTVYYYSNMSTQNTIQREVTWVDTNGNVLGTTIFDSNGNPVGGSMGSNPAHGDYGWGPLEPAVNSSNPLSNTGALTWGGNTSVYSTYGETTSELTQTQGIEIARNLLEASVESVANTVEYGGTKGPFAAAEVASAGYVLQSAGYVYDVISVATATNKAEALSGVVGSLVGAEIGAEYGAFVGFLIGGPVGAGIGAFVGSVLGNHYGEELGKQMYGDINSPPVQQEPVDVAPMPGTFNYEGVHYFDETGWWEGAR